MTPPRTGTLPSEFPVTPSNARTTGAPRALTVTMSATPSPVMSPRATFTPPDAAWPYGVSRNRSVPSALNAATVGTPLPVPRTMFNAVLSVMVSVAVAWLPITAPARR